MNADDQKLTQPENQDEEEHLLARADGELAAPDNEAEPGDSATDEMITETVTEKAPDEVQPASEETPVSAAPNSAAPPRIVAETPLGGAPRSRVVSSPEPGGLVEKYEIDDTTKEIDPRKLGRRVPPPATIKPVEAVPPKAVESAVLPAAESVAPPVEAPAPPDQPPSRVTHTEPAARSEDWGDDDISSELAAVLFGERKPKSEPKAESAPADHVSAPAAAPKEAPKAVEVEPPAAPISLTNVAGARQLRITAREHSAAAPDVTIQGKARYMRIEEPYKGAMGQRTTESWRYFKPDYPSLDGRLIKAVEIEEILYADGSWHWKYERRYSDGGRDRREVRTNTDRTYIERHDEVSKLGAEAGKRVQYKEAAALILAEAEREEKRGFLSGLLGRDDDEAKDSGAKVWRDATSSESRHARKNGGEALRRRFLGIF